MSTSNTPTVQKDLHISFALVQDNGPVDFFTFPIKPEELTRAEPSRTAAVNSLGGAWVDTFGRGLTTLTISGNTGWRRNVNADDGIDQFKKLRDDFIHAWHELREMKSRAGVDPGEVHLIFIDPLNGNYVAEVVPMNFTLRRSKSQPLLLMYNITLTVVNDKAVAPTPESEAEYDEIVITPNIPASIESLNESVKKLNEMQEKIEGWKTEIEGVGASIVSAIKETFLPMMTMAQDVIKTANDAKQAIDDVAKSAISIATELSATAKTAMDAVASVASIPAKIQADFMQVKGAFSNISCVLSNGFTDSMAAATRFDTGVYGASNCSSTAGGSPASSYTTSGSNTFASQITRAASVSLSAGALGAMRLIRQYDVTQPVDLPVLKDQLDTISTGVMYV